MTAHARINGIDLTGKRLLIFDLDGTIADTSPLHEAAFARVLGRFGIAIDYAKVAGMSTRSALRRIRDDNGLAWSESQIEELAKEKQDGVRRAIASGLNAMPGMDSFIRCVLGNYRLALVTSGSRDTVNASIHALGYRGIFEVVITADDVENGKPSPEGFLKALDLLGVAPEVAVIIEDSEAGFLAAQLAGVDCIDARRIHLVGN